MTHPRSIGLALLRKERPDVAHVQDWLDKERGYAEGKWPTGTVDDTITDLRYVEWVEQYLSRSLVLGLETPLGRQALGKALRTLLAFTESTVRTRGPLPMGGVASGEVILTPDPYKRSSP